MSLIHLSSSLVPLLCHSTTLLLSVIHLSSSASLPRGPLIDSCEWPQGPPSQSDRTNPLAWPSDTLTWQTDCQADGQAADAAVSHSARLDAQLALRLVCTPLTKRLLPKVNEKRGFFSVSLLVQKGIRGASKTKSKRSLCDDARLQHIFMDFTSSSYIS